jgi:hypothetical protein
MTPGSDDTKKLATAYPGNDVLPSASSAIAPMNANSPGTIVAMSTTSNGGALTSVPARIVAASGNATVLDAK